MRETKADKVVKLLTEQVAGQPRIRLTSSLAKLDTVAVFDVLGEGDRYVTTRYFYGADADLLEECSCPAGARLHPGYPACTHMTAARMLTRIMGWTR